MQCSGNDAIIECLNLKRLLGLHRNFCRKIFHSVKATVLVRPVCDFNIISKTTRFSVKRGGVWLARAALQPKLSNNHSAILNNIQIKIAADIRLLQTVDKAVVLSHTSRLRRPKRHARHPHDSSGMCLFLYSHIYRSRSFWSEAVPTRTKKKEEILVGWQVL